MASARVFFGFEFDEDDVSKPETDPHHCYGCDTNWKKEGNKFCPDCGEEIEGQFVQCWNCDKIRDADESGPNA